MSYQALYRVWRPKNFSDVVGQSHITRTLQNAVLQNKFSHAYLFSGPRGTGKTSAAKIFAKAVNCETSPSKEPCNQCSACLGIQDGSISDVLEIDAASNNGVEQIRDIRDKVKYAPSAVSYKVYIIDEVHMLSIGAFNALLKTLEEPPKHVIFILATTEPHKIPLTVISRCQRFDFKRIPQSAMVDRMKTIVEEEGIDVEEEAMEAVALSAEGGMRDALSLLDQAVSYSEETVKLDDVLAVTGSVSQSKLAMVVQSMHQQNVHDALNHVDTIIQEGKDPGRFVFDLIYYLRDLLLFQSAPGLENALERAILNDTFKELSEKVNAAWIQNAISELNQCQQEIKWTNSPKVFIEITVLNIADAKPQPFSIEGNSPGLLEKLANKVAELEKQLQDFQKNPPTVNGQGESPAPPVQQRAPVRSGKNSYKVPFERIRHVLNEASKAELKTTQSKWAVFMDSLKKANAPAHATVQNSKPVAASSDYLIMAFKYEIHCSLALDHKQTIESLLSDIFGKPVSIIPVPETNWQEIRADFVKKQKQQEDEGQDEPASEDPLVAEARKLVGDDLLEVHE